MEDRPTEPIVLALRSFTPQPTMRLWLVLGTFLLAQLAGTADLPSGHGVEPAVQPEAGDLVFPEACHPREVPHLEATGRGQPVRPGALRLHQLRSAGAQQPRTPRLVPPATRQASCATSPSWPSSAAPCTSGSRAPPF